MKKIQIYILVLLFMVLFNACEKKSTHEENANSIENIIIDDAYVVLDNAKVMSQYRDYNEALLERFDIDFRTITTTTSDDIDIFANKEFAKLQTKSRSKTGKAILMVINTAQDKVRLEVSMALEPVYTDAFISYIERKGFVPYFRNDTIADAIYMATELVMDRANDAKAGIEFMPPMESKSIGAGAKTKAHIGKVYKDAKKGNNISVSSSDKPKDILNKYLKALKTHNTNPNLDIYSDATKKFFQTRTVTEINQNNEIQFLEPCMQSKIFTYSFDSNYAVGMNHPVKQRTCSPYFFKKEHGKWRLDIATMAKVLRFNVPMEWHFDLDNRLKDEAMYYAFAFDGYGFDKHGFPFVPDYPKEKGVRWGYQCGRWFKPEEAELYRQNQEKYIRCWINKYWRGSPAEVRLGLDVYDYVIGVGEGINEEDANYKTFMSYMKNIPSGEVATVTVNHYDPDTKQTTRVVRRGIAP